MNKREIIERLKNIAGHAVHTVGEVPFVMSLDDGIAVHEAIEMLAQMRDSEFMGNYGQGTAVYTDYAKEAYNMAVKALDDKDTNVRIKSALDHIHNVVRDDAYKRGYEQGKADMAHTIKDKTLVIKVSEEDVDRIKRVILDCDPWCKTFYDDSAPTWGWLMRKADEWGMAYGKQFLIEAKKAWEGE